MKTLDNFLSQKIIVENTVHDFVYLIPDSNNYNIAYGFMKHGIPYVIRLAEITNTVSSGLWELKISKLKYAKDLKEYKSDQASMDKHSLEYYLEAMKFVFEKLPVSIKLKIKGLIFNLPQTAASTTINFLSKKLILLFKHSIPALQNVVSPSSNNIYKWIFAHREVDLKSIFTEFENTNIDDFNEFDAVNHVFENPKIYHSLRTIKSIKNFSLFPEIEIDKTIDYDKIQGSQFFLQTYFHPFIIKEIEKKYQDVHEFIDENQFKPFINYFASADIIDHLLEQPEVIKQTKLKTSRISNIKSTKEYYDFILDQLNEKNNSNFLITFIANCRRFFIDYGINDVKQTIKNENLLYFLRFCQEFVTAIEKHSGLAKNFASNPILDSNEKFKITVDDSSNSDQSSSNDSSTDPFEEKFKELEELSKQTKSEFDVYGKINFFNDFNYSLNSTKFREDLYKYRDSFVKYYDRNDYDISEIMTSKYIFDLFIKSFNANFEKGFETVLNKLSQNKLKELRQFQPEFYDYILHFLKVNENAGNINFDKDLFLKEKIYSFNFTTEYDFIDNYFDLNARLEQKTFNFFLKTFCKVNKIDVAKITFYSELSKISEQVIDDFEINLVSLDEEIDETNLLDKFKNYMKFWFKDQKGKKIGAELKDENLRKDDSQFIKYVKEQLDNPNDKNRLDILKYKQKVIKAAVLHDSEIIDSLDEDELKKLIKPFEKAYNPFSSEFDHNEKNDELQKKYSSVWDNKDYRKAIHDYTEDPASNAFFRNKRVQDYYFYAKDQVKPFLDPSTPKLDQNLVVIRGSKSDKWLANNIAGDYVVEPGFLSTSIYWSVGDDFAGSNGIYYLFYIPKGSSGLYIEEITGVSREFEFLLPPGTVFRIISIENRAITKKTKLTGNKGLIYSLLLVNTITEHICEEVFGHDDDWKEFNKTRGK